LLLARNERSEEITDLSGLNQRSLVRRCRDQWYVFFGGLPPLVGFAKLGVLRALISSGRDKSYHWLSFAVMMSLIGALLPSS
jgi:NADH:ubiquinone oxidoreductase subunit 2 (subunit N)